MCSEDLIQVRISLKLIQQLEDPTLCSKTLSYHGPFYSELTVLVFKSLFIYVCVFRTRFCLKRHHFRLLQKNTSTFNKREQHGKLFSNTKRRILSLSCSIDKNELKLCGCIVTHILNLTG